MRVNEIRNGLPRDLQVSGDEPYQPRRISDDNCIGGHISGHNTPGSNNGVLANRDSTKNGRTRANRRPNFDHGRLDLPLPRGLQSPVWGGGSRIPVIDERYVVPDEDIVFDNHLRADESVTGNLAILSDERVLLNFHKGADLGVVP